MSDKARKDLLNNESEARRLHKKSIDSMLPMFLLASVFIFVGNFITQSVFTVTDNIALNIFSIGSAVVFMIAPFTGVLFVSKKGLGTKFYLKTQANVWIEELPNLIQIISLPTLFVILLKGEAVKSLFAVLIVMLVYIYVARKRRIIIEGKPLSIQKRVENDVFVGMDLSVSFLLSFVVYALITLITIPT